MSPTSLTVQQWCDVSKESRASAIKAFSIIDRKIREGTNALEEFKKYEHEWSVVLAVIQIYSTKDLPVSTKAARLFGLIKLSIDGGIRVGKNTSSSLSSDKIIRPNKRPYTDEEIKEIENIIRLFREHKILPTEKRLAFLKEEADKCNKIVAMCDKVEENIRYAQAIDSMNVSSSTPNESLISDDFRKLKELVHSTEALSEMKMRREIS